MGSQDGGDQEGGGQGGKQRFPIRFDRWFRWLAWAALMPPAKCYVEVDGEEVSVRMAWAFRMRFPRKVVVKLAESDLRPLSRGVHGMMGRWLVNGSGRGIVALGLEPDQRAWVLGAPVRVSELWVSLEEVGRFVGTMR